MPTDANGVHTLPPGYLAVTGEVIQATQHNPPLEDLSASMTQRMMRSGTTPMTGTFKIIDGAVGAPSIQFGSAPTTGVYKTSGGFGIAVNGTRVAEFGPSGLAFGGAHIGQLVPTSLYASVPPLHVMCYGQTLSRTSYPDLWVVAQAEIASGNLFYNNGNGSTTFGIGDLRGIVVAGRNDMGGVNANRLSTSYFGATGGITGQTGGFESHTLIHAQLPAVSLSSSGLSANTSINNGGDVHHAPASSAFNGFQLGGISLYRAVDIAVSTITATTTISGLIPLGGSSAAHNNVQPTMVCNYLLFTGA